MLKLHQHFVAVVVLYPVIMCYVKTTTFFVLLLRISMSHFKVCILLYIMKRLLFSLLIVLFGSLLYAAEPDSVAVDSSPINRETCTCKGIPMYGKVRVVDISPDFKVEFVDISPGIR